MRAGRKSEAVLVYEKLGLLVHEKLGLRMLRTVWLNLDLIWGIALAATGVIAPFV